MGFWFVMWLLNGSKSNKKESSPIETPVNRQGFYKTIHQLPMDSKPKFTDGHIKSTMNWA